MTAKPDDAVIEIDTGTDHFLLDLEHGIACSPAWPATWATGGELAESPIAWVVSRDCYGDLLVACPACPPRRGRPEVHTHGPSASHDGVYGHRRGHCGEGYVVIDRAELEAYLERRDNPTTTNLDGHPAVREQI